MAKQSLSVTYRPTELEDVVSQEAIRTILENQIKTGTFQHCYLFTGSSGVGKCAPLYTNILTPNGWVSMKDIKVGDSIFDGNGNITKVVGCYPQKNKQQVYRIHFEDKTYIDVGETHLNSVYFYNKKTHKKEQYVLNTLELIDKVNSLQKDFDRKYYLRVGVPKINFKYHKVSINPYLLGILIGDGCLRDSLSISLPEKDVFDKVSKILKQDYNYVLTNKGRNTYDYGIVAEKSNKLKGNQYLGIQNKLKIDLDKFNLLEKSINKHIPKEYLFNSEGIRLELLRGLFDSDGTVGINYGRNDSIGCYFEYSTSSKQLSDDFAFLVRSLGCVDTITARKSGYKDTKGKYHKCNTSYRHYIKVPNDLIIVSSKKHLSKIKLRQNEPIRKILSVEKLGLETCKCIKVAAKSETYIMDNITPTHNTTIARAFANKLNNGIADIIEVDGASNNSVDNIRDLIKQAEQQSLISKYKVIIIDEFHMITNAGQNALLKTLEDCPQNTIFILCTTDPQKVLPTIKSRSQIFQLTRIPTQKIEERLKYICDEENKLGRNITYDDASINYIARMSLGGMRLAISYLDTCLSLSNVLNIENVSKALGMNSIDVYFDLLYGLYNQDVKYCMQILDKMFYNGIDIKQFIKGFFSFVLDCSLYKIFNNSFLNTQIPETDKARQELAQYDLQQIIPIHNMLQILIDNIKYDQNALTTIKGYLLNFCSRKLLMSNEN